MLGAEEKKSQLVYSQGLKRARRLAGGRGGKKADVWGVCFCVSRRESHYQTPFSRKWEKGQKGIFPKYYRGGKLVPKGKMG